MIPISVFALYLSTDTVYSFHLSGIPSYQILTNNTGASLKIDSIRINLLESHTSVYELDFYLSSIRGGQVVTSPDFCFRAQIP
jgi:hypothetical protein